MGLTRFERDIIADALIDKPYHAWIIREGITEDQLSKIHDVFERHTKFIIDDGIPLEYRAKIFWKDIKQISSCTDVFDLLMSFKLDDRWRIVTDYYLNQPMKGIIKDMDINSITISFEVCYK